MKTLNLGHRINVKLTLRKDNVQKARAIHIWSDDAEIVIYPLILYFSENAFTSVSAIANALMI